MSARTPWADWFVAGVVTFGLRPADFWALTPREWSWLLAARAQPAPALTRAGLEALVNLYPDREHGN